MSNIINELSSDELELLLQLNNGIVSFEGKEKTIRLLQEKEMITNEKWYAFKQVKVSTLGIYFPRVPSTEVENFPPR